MAQELAYTLIKRRGLKNLTLRVGQSGIKIYAPKRTPQRVIDQFWQQHKDRLPIVVASRSEYSEKKEEARRIIEPLVQLWATRMGLVYNRVVIKDTRSRWGSCSTKKNLNFSYRVAFLPAEIRDYIIIHELSHLVHMNHSAAFWSLVSQYCPGYLAARRALRDIHSQDIR